MQLLEKGSALNLEIVKQLGGTQYLAGSGSSKYQDSDPFTRAGIHPVSIDIGNWLKTHPYSQGTQEFVEGLSVIDALMHIGVDGIRQVFYDYQMRGL
jgi:hypothetical protein